MDRVIEVKPTKKRILWIVSGILILAVIALLVRSIIAPPKRSIRVDLASLTLSTVSISNSQNYIPVTASVRSASTTFIDSTQNAIVEEIYVENGQLVEGGSNLVRLSNVSLQLSVIEKEAQITEQISNLYNIRLNLQGIKLSDQVDIENINLQIRQLENRIERRESYAESLGVPEEELSELKLNLKHQRKLLGVYQANQFENEQLSSIQSRKLDDISRKLEENLEFTKQTLEELLLKAPRDGELTGFDLKVGQAVERGERLGQISAIDERELVAYVDEYFLGQVEVGSRSTFSVGDSQLEAQVSKINSQVIDGRFEVVFSINSEESKTFTLGQNVTGRVYVKEELRNVLTIKNGPFYTDTKGRWVYVLDSNQSRALKREIEVSEKHSNLIIITSGLQVGEQVIVSSYRSFINTDVLNIE